MKSETRFVYICRANGESARAIHDPGQNSMEQCDELVKTGPPSAHKTEPGLEQTKLGQLEPDMPAEVCGRQVSIAFEVASNSTAESFRLDSAMSKNDLRQERSPLAARLGQGISRRLVVRGFCVVDLFNSVVHFQFGLVSLSLSVRRRGQHQARPERTRGSFKFKYSSSTRSVARFI